MKRIAMIGALAIVGCAPSIEQTPPADHTYIQFDPAASTPVVPIPNDLAIDQTTGKVNAPVTGSAANQEFTTDYLNTLDGFPVATPAEALVQGDLDPATVTENTVLVTDITNPAAPAPVPTTTDATNAAGKALLVYDPTAKGVVVMPPNGAWTKAHRYDVVILGGANGVKDSAGKEVTGSATWALARGANPVVDCSPNLTSPDCHTLTNLVPNNSDAVKLEALRLGYKPILDGLESAGIPRASVAALWTFTIVSNAEMRFDPLSNVIPFPNALATTKDDAGTTHVNLPFPKLADGGVDTTSLQGQLIGGLNTLDGFSLTAPIVSENSDELPVLTDNASLDPASITAATANVIPLTASPLPPQEIVPCVLPDMPGCASTSALPDGGYVALPDGGVQPQQLQFVPKVPMEEKTQYGGFVTTSVKDKTGQNVIASPTFALIRMSNSLVDSSGHSTVSGVSDAQAQAAEAARAPLKPFFDALDAQGLHRKNLALAWTFTTQSSQSVLQQLHDFAATAPTLPRDPLTLVNADTQLLTCGGTCPYPVTGIGHAFVGSILDAFALTGPGGTLNPAGPKARPIPFVLTIPSGTPPTNGWPVVIFGHGLQGNRLQAMAFASSLSQGGFAMMAIDEVWHGERISCTGLGNTVSALAGQPPGTFNDSVACASGGVCDEQLPIGRCVKGPTKTDFGNNCTYLSNTAATDGTGGDLYCQGVAQGQCRPTANGQPGASQCDGADWTRTNGQPTALGQNISGWNLFNLANLFATRDNFRQQVIDDTLEASVLGHGGATNISAQISFALSAPATYIDGTKIQYAGQSLGGILGTLYSSAAPEIHNSLLNVPAGDLIQIFLTTPNTTLAALRAGFNAQLASQGIKPATPGYDSFIGIAKWILDPADPVNAGHSLWNGPGAPADRQAFIQFIEGDHVLPNPTTQELIAASVRQGEKTCVGGQAKPCLDDFEFTSTAFGAAMPSNLDERHGFLLNGTPSSTPAGAMTSFGQSQAVQYLVTGTVKTTFP